MVYPAVNDKMPTGNEWSAWGAFPQVVAAGPSRPVEPRRAVQRLHFRRPVVRLRSLTIYRFPLRLKPNSSTRAMTFRYAVSGTKCSVRPALRRTKPMSAFHREKVLSVQHWTDTLFSFT